MRIDTFANRLVHAMSKRNIRVSELAKITGFDKGSISHYMSGRYKAKQDRVYILSQVLNVSPAWLMGFDVPMELTESKLNELQEKIKKLNNEQLQKIIDVIDLIN